MFFVRDSNEKLEGLLSKVPVSPETIGLLSNSGNWYELFDLVAFSSGLQPDDAELASLRDQLLAQVALKDDIKE